MNVGEVNETRRRKVKRSEKRGKREVAKTRVSMTLRERYQVSRKAVIGGEIKEGKRCKAVVRIIKKRRERDRTTALYQEKQTVTYTHSDTNTRRVIVRKRD